MLKIAPVSTSGSFHITRNEGCSGACAVAKMNLEAPVCVSRQFFYQMQESFGFRKLHREPRLAQPRSSEAIRSSTAESEHGARSHESETDATGLNKRQFYPVKCEEEFCGYSSYSSFSKRVSSLHGTMTAAACGRKELTTSAESTDFRPASHSVNNPTESASLRRTASANARQMREPWNPRGCLREA